MHVLITRPLGDGETLKSRIEQLGCRATLAPMISVASLPIPLSAIAGATALIATSRNALKALAASAALQAAIRLPLYVPGDGTAALASELGFKDVSLGPGTAADLLPALIAKGKIAGSHLVYLTGDVLAFDLAGALLEEGVSVERVHAYKSVAVQAFAPDIAGALTRGQIDAVMLMSPRTAETWVRLAGGVMTPQALCGMTHFCISPPVAKTLELYVAQENILIAAHPNLEEMLALVKRLAAHS